MFDVQKNKAIDAGLKHYTEFLNPEEQVRAKVYLNALVNELGPVVSHYPVWHPLVRHLAAKDYHCTPSLMFDYPGVSQSLKFVSGFISVSYSEEHIQETIDAIETLPVMDDAVVTYERIKQPLYHPNALVLLVRVNWDRPLLPDRTLPLYIVVPNIMKMVMASAFSSTYAEDWRSMVAYFLGSPHSEDESVFVNEETTSILKRLWNDLRNMGCFGEKRDYVPGEQVCFAPGFEDWPWRIVNVQSTVSKC